ncbi:hypothetical protein [Acinetobacter sp.]|uniref:hypothetical protein n=1 Tax=Acinetobacter sp. TaxID=472 RepID=UPI003D07A449
MFAFVKTAVQGVVDKLLPYFNSKETPCDSCRWYYIRQLNGKGPYGTPAADAACTYCTKEEGKEIRVSFLTDETVFKTWSYYQPFKDDIEKDDVLTMLDAIKKR